MTKVGLGRTPSPPLPRDATRVNNILSIELACLNKAHISLAVTETLLFTVVGITFYINGVSVKYRATMVLASSCSLRCTYSV